MEKRTEFNNYLKESIKSQDKIATATVRLILAALKDRDIAARAQGNAEGISDSEILSMLQSMIKQRGESEKTYCEAGREDLAEREASEIKIIRNFMPEQLGEDQVKAIIDQLISDVEAKDIKDMGKIMAALKSKYAGQIDMSRASSMVKDELAAAN